MCLKDHTSFCCHIICNKRSKAQWGKGGGVLLQEINPLLNQDGNSTVTLLSVKLYHTPLMWIIFLEQRTPPCFTPNVLFEAVCNSGRR